MGEGYLRDDAPGMSSMHNEITFKHPDDSTAIDAMSDAVRDIALDMFAQGPVAIGRGIGDPPGTAIEFGNVQVPNIMVPANLCAGTSYCAVSWEAVRTVYLNPDIYSSRFFEEFFGEFWGPTLTVLDPPEHGKYRSVMQLGFTPRLIKSYEDTLVRPVLARRFGELKPNGQADLVPDLVAFYPYEIIGGIVGFDPSDIAFIAECFARTFQANVDPEGAAEAGAALKAYSRKLVATRREERRNDLISAMLDAEVDGQPITDEHVAGLAIHLMSGGIDTTYKQSSIIVQLLLENSEQFELLKENRSLIPRFIEEALRYEGIGNMMARQAIKDTNLLGTEIPKGAMVFLMHGVTNRDPSRWSDPDVLDLRRDQKPHVQFSNGPHICIGQHLARLMLANFINHLIDDLPNLRWDPAFAPPKITGWSQRAALSLPVVWDRAI